MTRNNVPSLVKIAHKAEIEAGSQLQSVDALVFVVEKSVPQEPYPSVGFRPALPAN